VVIISYTSGGDTETIMFDTPVGANCPSGGGFGDGTSCGAPFQNFATGASFNYGGWKYFTIDDEHYLAAANYYYGPSTIYKWSSANNCFGNSSGTCGSALQTFPTTSAYYNYGGWEYFQYDSDHYLLSGNYYYDYPELFKWMPASNCFGNGTTCSTPLYSFPSPYLYDKGGFEHFTVGVDHYVAFADENSANPSKTFKFMPASNCFGNGTTCGTPTQTFSSPLIYARSGFEHFQIGTDQYLAAGNYSQVSALFKLNAVTCFGNDDACGAAHQTPTNQSVGDWEQFDLGAQKYVGAIGSNVIRLYKVMADCIGDGSACADSSGGNALQSITLSGVRDLSFGTGPQGTFLAAVASHVSIYMWQEAEQCFGNGTTCGTVYHTIPQTNLYEGEFFVEDSILYYINFYNVEPAQGYLMLYKWMASGTSCPAGGGFGNDTTCGSVKQQINVGGTDRGNALTIFVVDGKRYVWGVNSDEGNSGNIIYQWQPAQSCFGNGTTCSSKFPASPPGNEHGVEVTTYTIDGTLYGSYFLGNVNYTRKWNNSSNCFGNAVGTCGSNYATQSGLSVGEARVINTDSGDFLAIAGSTSRFYKWTYDGANCPANGYWGNGSSCDTNGTLTYQTFPNTNATDLFTSNTNVFLTLGSLLYKYTGSVASTCSLYKYDATNGTSTVAQTNSDTNFSTGPLTQTTTYTLTCDKQGGGQESVALVLGGSGTTVTAAATDAVASEAGDTGTFTISRATASASSLTVNYTMSGTATNGTDYTSLSGTAIIPANQASVAVTLTPLDDQSYEGSETATLTVIAGEGYTVGIPTAADITITDNETINQVPTITGEMLTITPTLVRRNSTVEITYNVEGLILENTCTISTVPTSALSPSLSNPGGVTTWQGTDTSDAITSRTTFTLTCTAPDGTTQSSIQQIINLVPSSQEI
jgi:hypothetical protein